MSIVACSVGGCEKLTGMKGTARGWCSMHYNRWLRNGDPLVRTQRIIIESCIIDGCNKPHDAKGLCVAHITNMRRYGSPIRRKPGEVVDGKKICKECKKDLPVSTFYRMRDAYNARCAPCASDWAKAYRETRIEIVRSQARAAGARRPLQRRDAARKRRARLREVSTEEVSSILVYDRDGWVCGICQTSIPRVTVWPHPLSPSLDHIQAISVGGDHSYANTQASHLACNMSKGARAA